MKFINFFLATTLLLLHCLNILTDADSDTIKKLRQKLKQKKCL